MLFFPDGLGRDLIRLQESYFWPEDPGINRTSWKDRDPFKSPQLPIMVPDLEMEERATLSHLPVFHR